LGAIREFGIDLDQLHNDSTTLTLTGDYKAADGREVRGKPTLGVTYGYNKDHRPDLKQLLFVLSVSADEAVPIHYRALDGNTSDSMTHIDSGEMLRKLAGRPDFLYVADCKLCSKATLAHIDKHQGRFITVLPRNRREDRWFRSYIQIHDPPWEEAVRRPNPRRRSEPEDVWKVVEAELPSKEGYRIVWVWNSMMAQEDSESRQGRIEKAYVALSGCKPSSRESAAGFGFGSAWRKSPERSSKNRGPSHGSESRSRSARRRSSAKRSAGILDTTPGIYATSGRGSPWQPVSRMT
jgi:hypothetical protein